MHKTSYKDILYSTGIQPIFYNRHRWSITVENCGSLCCTPVIYIILYINLKKVPFKGSEHSLSAGYRRTMLTSDSLWTYNPPLTPLGERFDPRTLHVLGGELRCRWPTTSWSEISQPWQTDSILQYLSSGEKSLIRDMPQSTRHDTKSNSREHVGIVALARIKSLSARKGNGIKRTAAGKNGATLQDRHATVKRGRVSSNRWIQRE